MGQTQTGVHHRGTGPSEHSEVKSAMAVSTMGVETALSSDTPFSLRMRRTVILPVQNSQGLLSIYQSTKCTILLLLPTVNTSS